MLLNTLQCLGQPPLRTAYPKCPQGFGRKPLTWEIGTGFKGLGPTIGGHEPLEVLAEPGLQRACAGDS